MPVICLATAGIVMISHMHIDILTAALRTSRSQSGFDAWALQLIIHGRVIVSELSSSVVGPGQVIGAWAGVSAKALRGGGQGRQPEPCPATRLWPGHSGAGCRYTLSSIVHTIACSCVQPGHSGPGCRSSPSTPCCTHLPVPNPYGAYT